MPAAAGEDRKKGHLELEKVVSLPSIPTVYAQVSKVASDSKSSIADLTKAIENDQAVAAKALRIANSAAFGLYSRVNSLHHACALLGMRMVRNVVLQTTLMSQYDKLHGILGFNLEEFWKHTVLAATAAREISKIAKSIPGVSADDCYTAGLLHDLGRLVLLDNHADLYAATIAKAAEQGIAPWEAEAATFGFDHAYIGSYLASKWGFPEPIVASIRFHHGPPAGDPNENIAVLVALANNVAHFLTSPGADTQLLLTEPRLFTHLGVDAEKLAQLIAELQKIYGKKEEGQAEPSPQNPST